MSKRRFRWSLLSVFLVVAVCAAVFALIGRVPKPKDRFFVDPNIVAFIKDAESIEVFRLAPTDDLLIREDDETHDTYPVAVGPVEITGAKRDRLCKLLLDQRSWQPDSDVVTSYVPNFYEHRIRFRRGFDTLDFDSYSGRVAMFYGGKVIDDDYLDWSAGADNAMERMIEEFITR